MEQFNEVAAQIFQYLYERFPTPSAIHTHLLVGGSVDEYELTMCAKSQFACDVVDWLVREKFINASGGNLGTYHQCFLTAKGLAALNETPASLGGKESVIEKIKKGLSSGSKEALNAAIGAGIAALASHI